MRPLRLFPCCLCISLLFTACSLALPGAAVPVALSTSEALPVNAAPTDPPTATAPVTETPVPSPTPLRPGELLWVANPADGNLRLIEPVTGSVAVIIPTGMQPEQVVVGEGSAWALDRISNRVLRISLADYSLTAVIPIPQGVTDTIAVGEGYAWVGITERPLTNILLPYEEYHPAGGVLRIDPATNHITGYAATGPVADMAAAQGGLWVLARGEVDTPLKKVDPLTLTAQPVRLGGTSDWLLDDSLAVTADSLWLFSQAYGKLYRVSHTGRLYAEIPLGQHRPSGQARLLEAQGAIWLASPWGSLVRVDSGSNRVASEIDLGVPLNALGVSGGMLWAVSAQDGLAFRFDPAAGAVTGRVELGERLTPTPVMTATPILRAYLPCETGPYSRLVVGDRAHTSKEPALPQRLHKEAAKDSDRTGWIQPGETVLILEGPVCAENWVWWKVRTQTGGYTGWATEGDAEDYWLIPNK